MSADDYGLAPPRADELAPGAAFAEPGGRRRRRRRRREGRRRRDFTHLLPHFLTTGNLAAGFFSIVKSMGGDFDRAALALVVSAVCDMLDGFVARRAGATSRFGVEYDSIADTVSFGVAPAIIVFTAGGLHELGWTGWVLAFMYTACAALRLARFNVSPGRYKGRFEGLPSPGAAAAVVSSVWFFGFLGEGGYPLHFPAVLPGLGAATLGLLMVSPIPYRSFKDVKIRGRYRATVLMVIGFAVMLSKPSVTFFLAGIAYAASGPVEWWWRLRTGRPLEEIGGGAPASDPGRGTTA